jgi:hypothetical protein
MRNPRSTTILVVSPGCSATQQTKQVDRRIILSLFLLTNKLEACVTWNAYPELTLINLKGRGDRRIYRTNVMSISELGAGDFMR